MRKRSTTNEAAFGSRHPLPPRVASLDEEPTSPHVAKVDVRGLRNEQDTGVESLGPSDAVISAQQLSASKSTASCTLTVVAPKQIPITALDAKFSATHGLKAHVKWSDVAALGSEAFRLRATTKHPIVTVPFNIFLAIMKNADILDVLMLNCPDFPTLFALVASCTTAKLTFERHSQGIINAMLNRMPQELRSLTVALIGINGSQIASSVSTRTLMEIWLGPGSKPLKKRLQVCALDIRVFLFRLQTEPNELLGLGTAICRHSTPNLFVLGLGLEPYHHYQS